MDTIIDALLEPSTSIPSGIMLALALLIILERLLATLAPIQQRRSEAVRLDNIKKASEFLGTMNSSPPARTAMHQYIVQQASFLGRTQKAKPKRSVARRIEDAALLIALVVGIPLTFPMMQEFLDYTGRTAAHSDHSIGQLLTLAIPYLIIAFFTCGGIMTLIYLSIAPPTLFYLWLRNKLVATRDKREGYTDPEYMI